MPNINTRIKNKRDTSSNWTTNNPVLLDGELIIVDTKDGYIRFKIGDGVKTYTQLPFQDELLYSVLSGKVNISDITNDLSTNDPSKPLSAAQGVALKGLIDALPEWTKSSSKPTYTASEIAFSDGETFQQKYDSGELDGEDGQSGVYVGAGEMPANCNVQIDPNGSGDTLEEMIDAALQEAKDSGEFKGDKGDKGDPGKNGQDGTVTFDELTDAQKSELTAGITEDLAESFQSDLVSIVKITSSGMFAEQAYGTMLSHDNFTVDTLKIFTVVEKNAISSGNYYGGHTFIGLYKDDRNYLKLWTSGYNLVLDNVVNGVKTSTTITSIQTTVTPCSDVCTIIDFLRNKLELHGLNAGAMTTIVNVDLNTLDLSTLDSFKLMCGAGKYNGYQANIYARINDYFDYATLMNQPLYMSNYNSLPVVDTDNTEIYDATSIALGGTITSTISATHKISEVSTSPNGYFAFGAYNTAIQGEGGWGEIVRFKVTNISDGLYFTKATAYSVVIWDEDGNVAWNGTGSFYPEAGKWYYKCAVSTRALNYGASYNMYAYGTFTMELEALCICKPKSQNMCAETWNGQYFTGVLPFKGTGISFISVTGVSYPWANKFMPILLPYISTDGSISMFNGTKWVTISNT